MDIIEPTGELEPEEPIKIKHLVISGGGSFGFSVYKVLKESNLAKRWNFADIETIFATSAGTIIAVILALQYDWEIIDDFLLKRPWGSVFQITPDSFLSAYSNRGLFNKSQIENTFAPLFGGKDIPLNITLQGFYERTQIELHFFATELNRGLSTDVDLSHLSHPDWLLIDAVYCSCCIPGIFQPFIQDDNCFVDGGVFLNYPIRPCLDRIGKENKKAVLGFKRQTIQESISRTVNTETTLLDTVMIFFNKMMERALMEDEREQQNIQEIVVDALPFSITELLLSINSEKERNRLFEMGVQSWKKHLLKMNEKVGEVGDDDVEKI